MKKILPVFVFVLLILILPLSCDKAELSGIPKDADYIAYGTSFGECIGYCVRNIKMNDSRIEFTKNGWDLQGKLLEVKKLEELDASFWEKVAEPFDTEAFLSLDPVIGCPDCADGGAEWIEIKIGNEVSKVTFEYGNAPEMVKDYIDYLRAYLGAFNLEDYQPVDFNDRVITDQPGVIRNFSCSKGCEQFLIGLISGTDTTFYFDEYLPDNVKINNLAVTFNGVMQYDSTTVYKPSPTDVPVKDFEARNIRIFGIFPRG